MYCLKCKEEMNGLMSIFSYFCSDCVNKRISGVITYDYIQKLVCNLFNSEIEVFRTSTEDYFKSLGWDLVDKDKLESLATDTDFDGVDIRSVITLVCENIGKGKYKSTMDIIVCDEVQELMTNLICDVIQKGV